MKFSNLAQLLRGRADRADDQPRLPKGQHGGGQWTRLGTLASGSSAFSDRAQREEDSSSSDDRPEGWQSVRDTTNFPAVVRPRPLGPGLTPWLMAFNHASARNERGVRQSFIEFTQQVDGTWAFSKLQEVTKDRFNERCRELETATRIAELAAKEVHTEGEYLTQPGYGTAVHFKAKQIVKANQDRYPRLEAEMSIWDANNPLHRLAYETSRDAKATIEGANAETLYGKKGTIRTDLIEKLE